MRTFTIAAAVLSSIVALAPAQADPAGQAVSYADLNLSSAHDMHILNRRIAGAVEQVCGSYATAERNQEDAITACRKVAMTTYRSQLASITGPVRLAAR